MKHGECVSLWHKSYGETHQIHGQAGQREMDCVSNSQVHKQRTFCCVSSVSNSPQRSPLWLLVVSYKEEILVPS